MLIDAKKLWLDGGYGVDNEFGRSMKRIRQHGKSKGVSDAAIDNMLVDFFIELREDPKKYITENNECFCGCTIRNSGTNAIHALFRRLDDEAARVEADYNEVMLKELNSKIMEYVKAENERYIKKHGPKKRTFFDWLFRRNK